VAAVEQWPKFAEKAKLTEKLQGKIHKVQRLSFPRK
jgi:hypothetical protein